jgi:acyl-coenzyme A thioesterase PaaI-like protein
LNQTLAITKIEAVEEIGPAIFEVRVLLEDTSTATLRMNGHTLCSLADMVSQYATATSR